MQISVWELIVSTWYVKPWGLRRSKKEEGGEDKRRSEKGEEGRRGRKREVRKGEKRRGKGKGVGGEEEGCQSPEARVYSFFPGVCHVSGTWEQMVGPTQALNPGAPSLGSGGIGGKLAIRTRVRF